MVDIQSYSKARAKLNILAIHSYSITIYRSNQLLAICRSIYTWVEEFIDTIAIDRDKAEDPEYLETMKKVMREKNNEAINASEK